jgi:release factor glutamine methyltransferase
MKIQAALEFATETFAKAGIESAAADAELLLAHVLQISRGELVAKTFSNAEFEEVQVFNELVAKRSERIPLQHLTGVAHFRRISLKVGPGVFVPRPETEVVTQLAIDALKISGHPEPKAIDLATGSGAIALSMAVEVPNAKVFAIELSEDAMKYTRLNFTEIAPEAVLVQGDLVFAFPDLNGQVDVVVSNPPYIPDEMVPIYPEVHLHDPALALYGGVDGLDIVRNVDKAARRLLRSGGTLIIEHADMQGEAVRELLLASGWTQVRTHKDLVGRDRATTALA